MSRRHPHYDPKVIQARAHEALQADAHLSDGKQADDHETAASRQNQSNDSHNTITASTCFWAAGVVFVGGVTLALTGKKKSGGLLLTLGVPALVGYGVYQLLSERAKTDVPHTDNIVVN